MDQKANKTKPQRHVSCSLPKYMHVTETVQSYDRQKNQTILRVPFKLLHYSSMTNNKNNISHKNKQGKDKPDGNVERFNKEGKRGDWFSFGNQESVADLVLVQCEINVLLPEVFDEWRAPGHVYLSSFDQF